MQTADTIAPATSEVSADSPEIASRTQLVNVESVNIESVAPAAEGMEAIDQVNRTIPLPEIPDVPLAELDGLSLFDQFLKTWGTRERGLYLWQMWVAGRDDFGKEMLERLAQSTAEELEISLEEAKRRLAVEKVLSDVGPDYAIRFLEQYRAYIFTYSRPLKPMAVRPKRKK